MKLFSRTMSAVSAEDIGASKRLNQVISRLRTDAPSYEGHAESPDPRKRFWTPDELSARRPR